MQSTERLVIVGGVAAGMSAAAKVKRAARSLQVTVYERGLYISYAACGLPWFISGQIADARSLIARTPEEFEKTGVQVRLRHEVAAVDVPNQRVRVRNLETGHETDEPWDKILIATGGLSTRPPLSGIDLDGVFHLRNLEDGLAIRSYIDAHRPRRAVVVGAGYIGLEVLEGLRVLGVETVCVDIAPRVLITTFDEDMAGIVEEEVRANGVALSLGDGVIRFEGNGRIREVVTEHGRFAADIAILGIGIRPNAALARQAGVPLGLTGAVATDDHMRTSVPNVFSAGDCAEVFHRVTGAPAYIPLGSTANKQGRTAGANMAGGDEAFHGVVGTAVSKCFNLEVARTGLTEEQALGLGLQATSTKIRASARSHYYPGSTPLDVKLIYRSTDGLLLGGQIIGAKGAAKRIDVLATALHQRMTIDDIRRLDLSYAPPFAPVWDPILVAANVAAKE